MDTSAFEFLYGNEEQLPVHKKQMLQACRAGDLSQLQQIYEAHNIQPGAKLDWMENDDRLTTVFKLFITAIFHEHAPILRYLLFLHPEGDLIYKLVVQGIVNHPNLEIMELVCAHQPGIVDLGYGHTRTFLTEACQGDGTYVSSQRLYSSGDLGSRSPPPQHFSTSSGSSVDSAMTSQSSAPCSSLSSSSRSLGHSRREMPW